MNANDILQTLAIAIYEEPLLRVRNEIDYPDLDNPLHLVVLLIDCDNEIAINGILGFIENRTSEHLHSTGEALALIGAPKSAAIFRMIEAAMVKHGVTWKKLRQDFADAKAYQVSSFQAVHGQSRDTFAHEVCKVAHGFLPWSSASSPENVFEVLCSYLDPNVDELRHQIARRQANKK